MATPFRNSDKAGAVFSIGRVRSMPRPLLEPVLERRDAAGEAASASAPHRAPAGRRRRWRCPPAVLQSGPLPDALLAARGRPCRCGACGANSRNMPSRWKIWLIRSSARASLSLPVARHRHAPRHLGKAELLLEARGEGRIGEVVGEEAVVLCGQGAGLVLQPLGQHARLVEQHEPGAVRHQLGVRAVAHRDADGAAGNVLPFRNARATRGPTSVVSDR